MNKLMKFLINKIIAFLPKWMMNDIAAYSQQTSLQGVNKIPLFTIRHVINMIKVPCHNNLAKQQMLAHCGSGTHLMNDLSFFHHNSNSMEISLSTNSVAGHHITTKFCTWHDSIDVVSCAKFCRITSSEFGWKQNEVFITFELWKIVSEMGPNDTTTVVVKLGRHHENYWAFIGQRMVNLLQSSTIVSGDWSFISPTHWGWMTHICVGNLGHHWFR